MTITILYYTLLISSVRIKKIIIFLASLNSVEQSVGFFQFVRFANIEQDTPSYHTRYDFFVSKYSAMCHSNNDDSAIRKQIRLAGIQGLQVTVFKTTYLNISELIGISCRTLKLITCLKLFMQGVVRKTLSDDLVENIWEPVHMDKIVPSLLYNMQNSR